MDNQIFKCSICGKECEVKYGSFSKHLKTHNLAPKEYYDEYLKRDKEGICRNCDKPTKFLGLLLGYRDCCSRTCTNILKYGVDNPWKSKEIRTKIAKTKLDKYGDATFTNREKARETCRKNFGVDYSFQSEEVKEKIKKTTLDRHGVENIFQLDSVKEKVEKTNLEKYGAKRPWMSENIQEKSRQVRKNNIINYCTENDCILINDLELDYPSKILDDINVLTHGRQYFIRNSDIELAKELDKKYREEAKVYNSKYEAEIHSWLSSIYSGEILVNKYGIIKDDTKKQLDFYILDKKLAIEFNGDFIHSANFGKSANYHLNKTNLCSEQGIRLIHIFEHEWLTKQDILKSIISSALGIYKTRVYARKCEVREVSSSEARIFLETNHLQGFIPSSYRVGLYYNNELIQLLCFGKNRFKRDEIELLRMCTKLDTQVVGGFSKLLKYQPYEEFISYIDLSKFSANGYLKNGFEIISQSSPNYKYIKGERIPNRLRAQKHKLPKLLGDDFDASKTESKNMQDAGWWKVYDCGNLKLLYSRS